MLLSDSYSVLYFQPEMRRNYSEITFMPEHFLDYLIGEIGFESCEFIDAPKAISKGLVT